MTRPLRPIIPPPPGTKKAAELQTAEHDLFDAFLVIQELMAMGGVRCVTLAAGGIVNVVLSDDHPPEKPICTTCAAKPEAERDAECFACKVVPVSAPRPIIKRFLGINLFEGFLAAAAGGYAQVERILNQTENEVARKAAQAFVDHVAKIREVRTKRIITPS